MAQLGFHDFAGSCAIHMVGGISALVGAKILGPRIGKFTTDKKGEIIKVNAFPGHSIPLGALGVFILWLGWYGFNGAAATSLEQLASIFVTTTIAPAVATVVCMIFTWIKYGKPDVSMCLNASLAGLVAITAPCDVTDAFGSIIIGAVAGLLVVFGVWLLDYKTIDACAKLIRYHDDRPAITEKSIRRAISRIGVDVIPDLLKVKRAECLGQSLYKREEKLKYIDDFEKTYEIILQKNQCVQKKESVCGTKLEKSY